MRNTSFIVCSIFLLCFFLFSSIFSVSYSLFYHTNSDSDKIKTLPQQPKVDFQQYAGYVIVDESQGRFMFYYFVEAEDHPASKPLVIWLHGGPGCSSVGLGAFNQHGPFKSTDKGLVKNDHSWNKEANMLYLESPSGVGFSYSTNTSFYNFVTDEMAARDNLVFLQHWFKKFPQYQKNEFFIAGESYAGHFAPQLAELIIQTKTNINLKGIAIGNPLLEYNTNYNSRGEFLWSHGLISHSTYELLIKICNYSRIMKEYQSGKVSTTCLEVDQQLAKEVGSFMDDFDVMHEVCLPQRSHIHWWTSLQEENKRAFCPDEKVFTYLNRKEVQKALHARIGPWQSCSVLGYDIKSVDNPTISLLGTLIKLGVRVMVYSGDQDSIIPFLGTQFLLGELAKELGLNTSESFRPWYTGIKVAGSIQVYGDILSVVTVKGAGHSAASTQPEKTYVLFKSFLDRKSLPKFQM